MFEQAADIRGQVLILDEDPGRAARRCGQLTAAGWQTIRAGDTIEALTAVHAGEIDVALLHLDVDEVQAMDLPRVLRTASGAPHLPVVVMASQPGESARCQFLDSGADDILSDDVSPAELVARLRALLRVKLLQDELRSSRAALAASLARERTLMAQLRRDNAQLFALATTDALTHLHNVRHFDALLESEFKIARRYSRRLSVLALDLDHFKMVNDTFGHPAGDYVLKELAVTLKASVRDSDVVARTGGEEFGIILPNTPRAEAHQLAQRIRQGVQRRRLRAFGRSVRVTISIGLASYPQDAQVTDSHRLVYFADQALLEAKQRGRNRVISFDQLDPSLRRQLANQCAAGGPARRHRPPVPDPALLLDARR